MSQNENLIDGSHKNIFEIVWCIKEKMLAEEELNSPSSQRSKNALGGKNFDPETRIKALTGMIDILMSDSE